jgi:GTP 3',8-cyclase
VGLKVRTANISLEPEKYREITGRDFLRQTLEGIAAAKSAGFEQVKLNAVLMRGRNEEDIYPLIRFARREKLLLRFIELMPVTSQEMLTEANFMSAAQCSRGIRSAIKSSCGF